MSTNLSAVPAPAPRSANTLAGHAGGAATALLATIVGGIATPFLALAWIALSPVLPLALVIRAIGRSGGGEPATDAHRAAA